MVHIWEKQWKWRKKIVVVCGRLTKMEGIKLSSTSGKVESPIHFSLSSLEEQIRRDSPNQRRLVGQFPRWAPRETTGRWWGWRQRMRSHGRDEKDWWGDHMHPADHHWLPKGTAERHKVSHGDVYMNKLIWSIIPAGHWACPISAQAAPKQHHHMKNELQMDCFKWQESKASPVPSTESPNTADSSQGKEHVWQKFEGSTRFRSGNVKKR